MALLKVALTAWLIGTLLAPLTGEVETIVGAVVFLVPTVNVQLLLLASALPVRSWTPVVIVAVYVVPVVRAAVGVKVAVFPMPA